MSLSKTFRKIGKAAKKVGKFVHEKADIHNYIPGGKALKKAVDRVGLQAIAGAGAGFVMGGPAGAVAGGIAGGAKGIHGEVERKKQKKAMDKAQKADRKNREVARESIAFQQEEARKAEKIQADRDAKEKAESIRLQKEESDAIRLMRRRQRRSLIQDDSDVNYGRRRTLG